MPIRITYLSSLLLLFIVAGCSTPTSFHHQYATGHYTASIEQCAPYARKISGIKLYGDADSWWQQARGHYRRGSIPTIGSVLVLKKTSRMHSGHVAVVKDIIDRRDIDVTHSNWGDGWIRRHVIYDSMRAQDISPENNWSRVRFWNDSKGVMGFPYEAYGFIYP